MISKNVSILNYWNSQLMFDYRRKGSKTTFLQTLN